MSNVGAVGAVLMVGFVLIIFKLLTKPPISYLSKKESTSPPRTWGYRSSLLEVFKTRVSAWMFLPRGPTIIQDAYDKSKGAPFSVDVPENRYLVVSSWKHIKEIDSAPNDVLSL